MRKRSGQEHDIDAHFPHRMPGSVMVPCYACPEPGFNMNENDMDDMDDEDIRLVYFSPKFSDYAQGFGRHTKTLFLSADGHFGLMQKLKNNDLDDVSLLAGGATFSQKELYQEYIQSASESTEVCIILIGIAINVFNHFTEKYLLKSTSSKCPE